MKPIIFSTPMVRAILDGRKKCTRRVVKPQPPQFVDYFEKRGDGFKAYMVPGEPCDYPLIKPKYQPGDILWVRESWCENRGKYFYKADNICNGCTEDGICLPKGVAKHITCELCEDRDGYIKWRSPIFMPREAARIFLKVTNVRVERVQDISEEDAQAEGVEPIRSALGQIYVQDDYSIGYRLAFEELWNEINAKRGYGWDTNPWVWVIEFEKISKE